MSSKVIVTIFGASGDLAKRKLYPSLFRLYKSGNLSEHFAVIGTARRPWSKEYFESVVVESILDLADSTEQAQEFASHFYYQSHDVNDTEHYIALRQLQAELNDKYQAEHNKLFFLSMATFDLHRRLHNCFILVIDPSSILTTTVIPLLVDR